MLLKHFLSILLIIGCIQLFAQQPDSISKKQNKFKHELGINYGKTTGKGLSYRYNLNRLAIQLSVLPEIKVPVEYADVSTSMSFLYRIKKFKHIQLFLYQSNQYDLFYGHIYPPACYNTETGFIHHYNTGIGFGVELLFLKHFSLNLLAGYAALDDFNIYKLTVEAGIYYKF